MLRDALKNIGGTRLPHNQTAPLSGVGGRGTLCVWGGEVGGIS